MFLQAVKGLRLLTGVSTRSQQPAASSQQPAAQAQTAANTQRFSDLLIDSYPSFTADKHSINRALFTAVCLIVKRRFHFTDKYFPLIRKAGFIISKHAAKFLHVQWTFHDCSNTLFVH